MLGMSATAILVVLSMAAGVVQAGAPQASTAPATPPTVEMTIATVGITASDGHIYVDESCGLLPDPALTAAGPKKPRVRWDPVICHLESVNHSSHREETVAGNELARRDVEVDEQEYVLQNVTMKALAFVVEQRVEKGWAVDSDPRPAEMRGDTAIFRVSAEPGEIVRLHVGVRHAKELKPKPMGSAGP